MARVQKSKRNFLLEKRIILNLANDSHLDTFISRDASKSNVYPGGGVGVSLNFWRGTVWYQPASTCPVGVEGVSLNFWREEVRFPPAGSFGSIVVNYRLFLLECRHDVRTKKTTGGIL